MGHDRYGHEIMSSLGFVIGAHLQSDSFTIHSTPLDLNRYEHRGLTNQDLKEDIIHTIRSKV
jgi:hypothetical protein